MDRYTVVSADCHAGADLLDYRPYLEAKFHADFDEWAKAYVTPFHDLAEPEAAHNWNSSIRTAKLNADGIAAEVVYPNTVPPFFPISPLVSLTPAATEFDRRLAGLRAHNRWLAEWCAEQPEHRAGVGQILLNNVDEAVRDVHWIADHNLRGGLLLPGAPPGSGIPPIYAEIYDPIWAACEQRGVILNAHGGGGLPDLGMHAAALALFVLEASFYGHRPLWSLIMAGVFDRHPGLRLVIAEAGTGWVPNALAAMDHLYDKMLAGNVGELPLDFALIPDRRPSEYFATNCWIGASFMTREDCLDRHKIGVDRIMWGSDFPHSEGTYPHSAEAIANTFHDVPPAEVAQMLGGTAAALYGFNLSALRPIAEEHGPIRDAVMAGLQTLPQSRSLAFEPRVSTLS